MSWIRIPLPEEVTRSLRDLWGRISGGGVRPVDNILRIQGLNPPALQAHFDLYKAVVHRKSTLSRSERELVATVVSVVNGCHY